MEWGVEGVRRREGLREAGLQMICKYGLINDTLDLCRILCSCGDHLLAETPEMLLQH